MCSIAVTFKFYRCDDSFFSNSDRRRIILFAFPTTTTTTTTAHCSGDVILQFPVLLDIFVSRLNTSQQNINCLLSRDLKEGVGGRGNSPPPFPPWRDESVHIITIPPQHTWSREYNPFELSMTFFVSTLIRVVSTLHKFKSFLNIEKIFEFAVTQNY
jgi:hypothetical protein